MVKTPLGCGCLPTLPRDRWGRTHTREFGQGCPQRGECAEWALRSCRYRRSPGVAPPDFAGDLFLLSKEGGRGVWKVLCKGH